MNNLKLPHIVLIILGVVGMILSYLMKQNAAGEIVLPAIVTMIISAVLPIIGLLTPAVNNATNERAVAEHRAKMLKAGGAP